MITAAEKQMAISLIAEATAAGAREFKCCEVMQISTRTLRRWRNSDCLVDGRKGAERHCPQALSEQEERQILDVCNSDVFINLPPTQIVPALADQGIYIASESTFYRVLRKHKQLHHRGRAKAPQKRHKPTPLVATGPNQVWTWDITYLPSSVRGQFFYLYMVIDLYSRMVVGWEVHDVQSADYASKVIEKACLRHRTTRQQLVLHSDNGSPMKGATMLATLQQLGIVPSFSRPSVSNDNPFSEAAFRTLKYTPSYPRQPFADLEAARDWVQRFVRWYNTEHRHSALRFVTPQQRYQGQDASILADRKAVYEAAKATKSERWRGRAIRNWTPAPPTYLNPEKPEKDQADKTRIAV